MGQAAIAKKFVTGPLTDRNSSDTVALHRVYTDSSTDCRTISDTLSLHRVNRSAGYRSSSGTVT